MPLPASTGKPTSPITSPMGDATPPRACPVDPAPPLPMPLMETLATPGNAPEPEAHESTDCFAAEGVEELTPTTLLGEAAFEVPAGAPCVDGGPPLLSTAVPLPGDEPRWYATTPADEPADIVGDHWRFGAGEPPSLPPPVRGTDCTAVATRRHPRAPLRGAAALPPTPPSWLPWVQGVHIIPQWRPRSADDDLPAPRRRRLNGA